MLLLNNPPSPPDARDHRYRSKAPQQLIERVDLREWAGRVEDQGELGSCTGSAMTDAYELSVKILYPDRWAELSKLFVYYNSRMFYDGLTADGGSYLRDTLKAARRFGLCREDLWPYDVTKFDQQPTPRAYVDAQYRTVTSYDTLYDQQEMLEVLNFGRPVIAGMTLFEGFEYLNQGDSVVAMPDANDSSIGSHAVCVVGYDLPLERFLVKNSFGKDWGDNGYFWMPFDYANSYVFERWCFDISNNASTV